MDKVYLVCLEYLFEGSYDTEITVCDSEQKALEVFEKMVKVEKEETWVRDAFNDPNEGDYEVIDDEIYFHCYDNHNYDYSTIYIREKEVL